MNFHQLQIFYTVAQRGSFSAAAQALHMTQPAVTMQIQSLEEHFGAKLLERSSKRIELTEAGRTLLPYARKSIDLLREADESMSNFTSMLEGRLLLGASLTIGEYVLPRLLGSFGQEFPHIRIVMKVMNTTQIMDDILKNQLNFGLIEAPVQHADIAVEPIMKDELKLIVPSRHPLAELEVVRLEEVLAYPFVLREQGSGTRQVMEEELARHQIEPTRLDIIMELGSTGAVKSAVEAGLGVTFLSPSSVKHEVALGLLKVIEISNISFQRQFYVIHHKSMLLPIPAVTFLSYLRRQSGIQHEQHQPTGGVITDGS